MLPCMHYAVHCSVLDKIGYGLIQDPRSFMGYGIAPNNDRSRS